MKKKGKRVIAVNAIKNRFSFRIGTTSYIIPDDLVPNVEFLAPLIDDVELVLFESDEISNLPDRNVIERLKELKREHGLSYTVHLPLDIQLGSADETERKRSVEKCGRVIDLTGPLDPFAYIVHFHGECRGKSPAQDMARWKEALNRSVGDLMASGIDPRLLNVETLDYPFEYVFDIVSFHGLSICLDVGHLAFYGYDIQEYLDKYFAQTGVMHIHGNADGVDHKDIGLLPSELAATLIRRLEEENERERVATMEIFGRRDFERSMDAMQRWVGAGLNRI